MAVIAYPALMEKGEESYGLWFPDLPGCVTAGDTMAELAFNAREALSLHIEGWTEDGVQLPTPTPIEDVCDDDPELQIVGVMLVEATVDESSVRVDVSLPTQLLSRIDREADARGMTRSAFLAESAKTLLKAG